MPGCNSCKPGINVLFTEIASTRDTGVQPETTTIESEPKPYRQDPRWALARRVAKSATFARSEQLPKLLLYVCKMAILERGVEINEQRIGVDVYGKSPDYDPAIDGIVRSHATRLRQKLESYFQTEGRQETTKIEIPRGGYVPRFYSLESEAPNLTEAPQPVNNALPPPSAIPEPPPLDPSLPGTTRRQWIIPFLAGLFISCAIIMAILHLRHDAAVEAGRSDVIQTETEIERRFWDKLFPKDGKTFIVYGDSGLVLYETVTGQDVTLSDYVSGMYRDSNRANPVASAVSQHMTFDLAGRRYSSVVDLNLALRLSHLPQWNPERTATVFARDLRPADASSSNLILVGSRQANPWVSLIEPSMNFILVPDGKRGFSGFYFVNRHPRKEEMQQYIPQDTPGNLGASTVYGDVTYSPNPSGQGMILSLSGLWMTGTQSAGNFVLNGPLFSKWLQSIVGPDGTIPPFELLISTKNLQGNSTDFSIVAERVAGR